MGWHSVVVVPDCGIVFGSGGAGLRDGVLLGWCLLVGWHSIAVVLG